MTKNLFFDIREEECRAYLFEGKTGKHELKDTRTYPLTDRYMFSPETVPAEVENTYVSLPLSSLNFRIVDLPFQDMQRVRDILPYELDGMVLGGSDSIASDVIPVGSGKEASQVLAVYADKKTIRDILQKLKDAGSDPVFVTSLELKHIMHDFRIEKLSAPVTLDESERVGLALEEMHKPVLNLRRGEFTYTRDIDSSRKSLRITIILLLLLAIVVVSDLVLKTVAVNRERNMLASEIRKTYQEMFPGEKTILNELHQFRAHMKELRDREDYFVGARPLDVLDRLSRINRQQAVFNEVQIERGALVLKGEAPSLSSIQQLTGALEGAFGQANLSDSKASANGTMLFTITAKDTPL